MRQIKKAVGGLRGKLGGLDVPGRGSDPKTLKEEGGRSVCGRKIKLVWLELKQARDCSGQSFHHAAALERRKTIGLKPGQLEYPGLNRTKATLSYYHVPGTLPTDLPTLLFWSSQRQSEVGFSGFVIQTRKYEAQID